MTTPSQVVFEKYSQEVKDFSDYDLEKNKDYLLQYVNTEVQFDWQLYQYAHKQAMEEVINQLSCVAGSSSPTFCGKN